MGRTRCHTRLPKHKGRRCLNKPIKNELHCCCHTLKTKESSLEEVFYPTTVNMCSETERRHCKRCHESTHISLINEENMCVVCVFKLETFIKEFYKEQARKAKELKEAEELAIAALLEIK